MLICAVLEDCVKSHLTIHCSKLLLEQFVPIHTVLVQYSNALFPRGSIWTCRALPMFNASLYMFKTKGMSISSAKSKFQILGLQIPYDTVRGGSDHLSNH